MIERLLLASCIFLLAGCLGTYSGRPEAHGPRSVKPRGRTDLAPSIRWRRIVMGAGKRATLLGYLRTHGPDPSVPPTHWVYDVSFELIGRISPEGKTVALRGGEETFQGQLRLDHAMLKLFGYTKEADVDFLPMPPPQRG